MLTVDAGFLVYWIITLAHLLPAEWLYAHHDDPVMVAWNWSFLPLDLLVSTSGLSAVLVEKRGDARSALLALISLTATSASGMNALAFWTIRGDFDLGWWAPHFLLLLGPWPFARALWNTATHPASVDVPE